MAQASPCAKVKRNIVGYFKAVAKVQISLIPTQKSLFRIGLNKTLCRKSGAMYHLGKENASTGLFCDHMGVFCSVAYLYTILDMVRILDTVSTALRKKER